MYIAEACFDRIIRVLLPISRSKVTKDLKKQDMMTSRYVRVWGSMGCVTCIAQVCFELAKGNSSHMTLLTKVLIMKVDYDQELPKRRS